MLLLSCLIIPFSNKFIQITMVIRVNDDYSIETVLNPIVASKLVTNGCFINDRGHHILIYTVANHLKVVSQVHGKINKSRWNAVYEFHHLWTYLESDNSNNFTVNLTLKWSLNGSRRRALSSIEPSVMESFKELCL